MRAVGHVSADHSYWTLRLQPLRSKGFSDSEEKHGAESGLLYVK